MFTGIIRDIGEVLSIGGEENGLRRARIKTAMPLSAASLGASVACSGVCLTVTETSEACFSADISAETLRCTTAKGWGVGTRLNLEPALRMGDELGGHIVSGHVDAIAVVTAVAEEAGSLRLSVEAKDELLGFLAPKGSVVLDGVSLTVNEVSGNRFTVNIVPHTRTATTLGRLQSGDMVNMEADVIARYVAAALRDRS